MVHFRLVVLFGLALAAVSASAQDTVAVKTGWNIIGSVKGGAVPDVLFTVPDSIITTSFFGYDPGAGYKSTDTLGKGLGYWVKVSADGIVVFQGAGGDTNVCGLRTLTYDGTLYRTIKVNGRCWLDRNLNVGTMVSGVGLSSQSNNGTLEKFCYNDSLVYCTAYGGFYEWGEAMQYSTVEGAQGICPSGWHIPTLAEFQDLVAFVGGDGTSLKMLGEGSVASMGTNTTGFAALLTGFNLYSGFVRNFTNRGTSTDYWSSTESDPSNVYGLELSGAVQTDFEGKFHGLSVRCIED